MTDSLEKPAEPAPKSTPTVPLAAPFVKKSAGDQELPKLPVFGSRLTEKKPTENKQEAKIDAPAGFVFGSKLAERVTNVDKKADDEGPKDASSIFKQFAAGSTTAESTTEIKPFYSTTTSKDSEVELEAPTLTVTGEENEQNLLHIGCKFYIFDRDSKKWQERGNGTLRINQSVEERNNYRIIGRATGNQRVCVNTKIYVDMMVEKLSDKRLKISAMNPDSEVPVLVVIHATPAAVATIEKQITDIIGRIRSQKRKRKCEDGSGVEAKKDNGTSKNGGSEEEDGGPEEDPKK